MKKLLFTGGTGFLGKNTMPILQGMYDVTTCGITADDMIKANLAKEVPVLTERYDVVLHACGKAHVVPKTKEEEQAFFDVNYQGTVNLCHGLEKAGVPDSLIFISTVAVYGCETGESISEDHPLSGTTPYAKSKIMAEEYLQKWCSENSVSLSILRPSLLAGKDAPGNLGAMVNGIRKGYYFNIGGGKAKKSVLMAEDIARLVPLLEGHGGVYNVCDTKQPTFGDISLVVARQMGKKAPVSIPYWMAWMMAKAGDLLGSKAPINTLKLKKITESLTFSSEKARNELEWEPLDVLEKLKI